LLAREEIGAENAATAEAVLRARVPTGSFAPRAVQGEMLWLQQELRGCVRRQLEARTVEFSSLLPPSIRRFLNARESPADVLHSWRELRSIAELARKVAPLPRREANRRLQVHMSANGTPRRIGLLSLFLVTGFLSAEAAAAEEETGRWDRGLIIAFAAIQARARDGRVPADAATLLGDELLAGIAGLFEIRPEAEGPGFVVIHVAAQVEKELVRVK
jgi:hypothetical protein